MSEIVVREDPTFVGIKEVVGRVGLPAGGERGPAGPAGEGAEGLDEKVDKAGDEISGTLIATDGVIDGTSPVLSGPDGNAAFNLTETSTEASGGIRAVDPANPSVVAVFSASANNDSGTVLANVISPSSTGGFSVSPTGVGFSATGAGISVSGPDGTVDAGPILMQDGVPVATELVTDALDTRLDAIEGTDFATQVELDAEASARSNADTLLDGRLDVLEAVDNATQAELNAHESDTTNVHGIADTSALVTTSTLTEQVQDIVGALLVAGTNVTLNYNDGAGTLTVSSTDTSLTTEQVQDIIGATLVAGSDISVTYDDTANTVTIAVSGLTSGDISDFNEAVDDRIDALIVDGSAITKTYNDAGNTYTLAVSVDNSTVEVSGDALRVKDGGITAAKLSFDPATQAELDAEASARASADTALDGRLDVLEAVDYATQAELDAHAADTTSVHGIADTSTLVTTTSLTEQVQDIVAALLVEGTNVTLTYDDTVGSITIDAPDTTLTTEQVQDIVGGLVVAGSNISATYNDAANTLTIAVTGLTSAQISDFSEAVDDRVNGLVVAGAALTKTYDDTANTYTLDVAVDNATIEVSSDALRVKAGSIGTAHLSFDPATQAELDAVNTALDGRLDAIEAVDYATQAELDAHINDATAAHAATAISYAGSAGLSATTVEAALDELDSEKAATSHTHVSADITDLAETIRDTAAAFAVAGANISITHDDGANTLTFAVTGLDSGDISDFSEAVDDRLNALVIDGSAITKTYDDTANTYTLAISVDNSTIEVSSDALRVKAGGITTSHLAFDPATQAELDAEASTRAAADTALDGRLDTLEAIDYATQAELDAHAADTTSVHGIADTSILVTTSTLPELLQDAVAAMLVEGTNVNLTYDDGAGTLTIDATDTTLTTEQVQDIVGAMVVEGANIDTTYDDTANTLTIAVTGLTAAQISDFSEAVDDRIDALVVAGTALTKTYNDAGNTYTLNVAVDDSTIEISSDALRVKDGGITAAKLSFDPATQAELDAVNTALDTRLDALEAVDYATQAELDAHINDTTAAHAATAISYAGSAGLSATTVEAALDELDSEKAAASHTHVSADITDLLETVRDTVAAFLVEGTNVTITHDDVGNTLTIDVTGGSGGLTEEEVEDVVDGLLVEGDNITLTYDDVANTLTIAVSGLTASDISDFSEAVDDRVNALTVAGAALTKTYDDGANTLTFDVAVDNSTIEVSSDALRVKDGGITAAKLSFDPATQTELDAVNTALDTRLDALEAVDYATQAELDAHIIDTSSVHGFRDTLDVVHATRMERLRTTGDGWLTGIAGHVGAPAKIFIISDSWDDDFFAAFSKFEEMITGKVNGISSTNGGWNPIRSQTVTWTLSGTAGSSSTAGPAGYAENMPVGRIALSPLQTTDRISFHGAGTFDLEIVDSGGATVQTALSQVVTAATPWISNAMTQGSYRVRATSQHASSVGHGAYYYLRNYTSGVQVWRLGHTGWKVSHYTAETHWVDLMNFVDPHAIISELGINDRADGASTYRTNLDALHTILTTNQASASYYIWFAPEPTGTAAGVWAAMYAEATDFVDDNGYGFIDAYRIIPALSGTYSGDGVHPTSTMVRILGDMTYQILMEGWENNIAHAAADGSRAGTASRIGIQDGSDAYITMLGSDLSIIRADLGGFVRTSVGDATSGQNAVNRQTGDARYTQLSIIDAKGDILAGTAADALDNLTVGTNRQVLTADSGQTTGLRWATPADRRPVQPAGAIAWTFDRMGGGNIASNTVLVSGTLHLILVEVPVGVPITSITFMSGTTALSGGSNQWFLLADTSRVVQRRTSDDTTAAWAANTAKTLNLTSTYTPTATSLYVGIMVNATTVPDLMRVAVATAVVGVPPISNGRSNTGATTRPNEGDTLTALTANAAVPWGWLI